MNKLIYLFLMVFILTPLVSCQEDEDQLVSIPITGEWELRQVYNPWAGTTNYPAGNGSRYVFTNNRYQQFEKGTLLSQGQYFLKQEVSKLTHQPYIRLVLDDESRPDESNVPISVTITGDQLYLGLEAYDAPSSTYDRVK